ncbi:hypothetical protein COLO4_19539 [Corchorus olitorius]|uniref:Uncharacterized protein n=1 Tax=Corchorus olitorius TaxID=93759 RepID=A0A1R3J503_9ROSI|nr:hypothetical protein COLO4_19539 [Corchorus olitorius]
MADVELEDRSREGAHRNRLYRMNVLRVRRQRINSFPVNEIAYSTAFTRHLARSNVHVNVSRLNRIERMNKMRRKRAQRSSFNSLKKNTISCVTPKSPSNNISERIGTQGSVQESVAVHFNGAAPLQLYPSTSYARINGFDINSSLDGPRLNLVGEFSKVMVVTESEFAGSLLMSQDVPAQDFPKFQYFLQQQGNYGNAFAKVQNTPSALEGGGGHEFNNNYT